MTAAKDAGVREVFLKGLRHDASNERLLEAAGAGSSIAWRLIVERYERLVWSVIHRYGIRRSDGQDVFQLSFLLLHTNIKKIREPEKLGLWLHTTTRRECVRYLKRVRRASVDDQPVDEIEIAATGTSPEEQVAQSERDYTVRTSLQQLSPACRSLLEWCLSDPPPSYDEIAARLNVKRGTVGAKRRRCLDRLGTIYRSQESNE